MKKAFLRITYALLALQITACLAYKSDGRKVFESRAPNNINQGFNTTLWCWTQNNTDEFWTDVKTENLILTSKEDGKIEVCTPESPLTVQTDSIN
jgi:hypothetical protein